MRLVETVNRGEIIKSFLTGYLTHPLLFPFYSHFLFHVKQSRCASEQADPGNKKGKPELPWFFIALIFLNTFRRLFHVKQSLQPIPSFQEGIVGGLQDERANHYQEKFAYKSAAMFKRQLGTDQ